MLSRVRTIYYLCSFVRGDVNISIMTAIYIRARITTSAVSARLLFTALAILMLLVHIVLEICCIYQYSYADLREGSALIVLW